MDQEYLKCDALGCDHVEMVDEITAKDIGRPCPVCGANLLTESDYKMYAVMRKVINFGKAIGLVREPKEGEKGKLVSIHHHNGKTSITEKDQ